ncbi:MAG: hypothetical protein A2220_11110 [Ignavibacteria bacterium RIFOXYA2_FULL_35_10]|nr:MAG: hypothetical protein A2220_11110 [Ignavibacteria bacterium RIFOXYA2_FULL_35_10]
MAKFALLVGINDYKKVNDLNGCINDVTNVRNILKTYFGFNNNDIRVLVDNRATKTSITHRLKWMVGKAKAGDFLVFHFSGHGSQILDRHNDELNDHKDELICPYDMDWDGTFIIDDDLNKIFKALKEGVHLEVLLDSCHSGTGTRDLIQPKNPGNCEFPTLYRYLPPPPDIICRSEGEDYNLKPTNKFKIIKNDKMNHILWAGCKDIQTSADAYIIGSYNGAFSYYFCKHVRDAGGNITRSELIKRINNSLSYNQYTQTPQLECENKLKSGKVFG